MSEYKHDLPYGILDVANLLGVNIRRKQFNGVYVDCLFCEDTRGKLFLNTILDSFHCNYCDARGGILRMYARRRNITRYEARCEIEERLHLQTRFTDYDYTANERKKAQQHTNSTLALDTDVHDTFTQLLGMLTLSDYHRRKLYERGLNDSQIDALGYRTVPRLSDCAVITNKLLALGLTVEGVPGFYQKKDGGWTLNVGNWSAGFLVPYRKLDGYIGGFQIRLDTPLKNKDDPPKKDGAKYIWLSSASKHMGVSSGSPVHFIGNPNASTVYVTEGALKSDIAHCLSGKTFVATAGANNVGKLDALFATLAGNGVKQIIEAEDMDKLTNKHVARGAAMIRAMANANGLESRSLTWNNYKGIDDWLLAQRNKRIMAAASAA